jgi:hypothetical protein
MELETKVSCRVGILYRGSHCIKSAYIPSRGSVHAENGVGKQLDEQWKTPNLSEERKEIEQWLSDQREGPLDHDDSYLGYFYRCLEEGSVYYYLYEHGVGWSCGDVTGKSPISSQLVKLSDAIPEMEEWAISLKYQDPSLDR